LEEVGKVSEGRALFADPQLVIIKRISAYPAASRPKISKYFDRMIHQQSKELIFLFWEPADLPADHWLVSLFAGWEQEGMAAVRQFRSPSVSSLGSYAQKIGDEIGVKLDSSALSWLRQRYSDLELQASKPTSYKKVAKKGETAPVFDERTWWLYHVIRSAALLSHSDTVSGQELQVAGEIPPTSVEAFSIVRAMERGQWHSARELIAGFLAFADEGSYLGLLGAFRWSWLKRRDRVSGIGLQLLAEIEVALKNSFVEPINIFLVLINELEAASEDTQYCGHVLPPRSQWLAGLGR
jgi:hypothetical protein